MTLPKINYTPAERKAIDEAYMALEYATEAMRMASLSEFAQAAAMERRECATVLEAKAQVCCAVYRGLKNPSMSIDELAGLRHGYCLLVILGAEIAKNYREHRRRLVVKLEKAEAGHHAATRNHVKMYGGHSVQS